MVITGLQWQWAGNPQKLSFWQKPAEHTRCFVWQVRATIIEFISPEKITNEFEPKVRSFSKILKTCHQGLVTIVAVSTWNRKRHLSLHQNQRRHEQMIMFYPLKL